VKYESATSQQLNKVRWSEVIKTVELSRIKTIAQLKTLLKNVQKGSDQYLFTQKGKIIAALVPSAHFEAIVEHDIATATQEVRQKETARQALFKVMDKVQEKNLDFSEEEVEQDIMAAREEIRHAHA
jgi:hypothetical protein